MTRYYGNTGDWEVTETKESLLFDKVLGGVRQHLRMGRFHVIVSDRDVLAGEKFIGEQTFVSDPHTVGDRITLLKLVERKIKPTHGKKKALRELIRAEREHYDVSCWWAIGNGERVRLEISGRVSQEKAEAWYLGYLGRKRMPRGVKVQKGRKA